MTDASEQMTTNPVEPTTPKAVEETTTAEETTTNTADDSAANVAEQVESVKSAVTSPLPTPPEMSGRQAPPQELLERLRWGEPALTIIDARDREAFNNERITGAVPMPEGQFPSATVPELEVNRDIYLYSDTAESATQAANQLRQAGYQKVAELQGGLSGWKRAGGPTEGIEAFASPRG
jgi:rhodanese-related sulfurtransferase